MAQDPSPGGAFGPHEEAKLQERTRAETLDLSTASAYLQSVVVVGVVRSQAVLPLELFVVVGPLGPLCAEPDGVFGAFLRPPQVFAGPPRAGRLARNVARAFPWSRCARVDGERVSRRTPLRFLQLTA
jgi:hypothetical protein